VTYTTLDFTLAAVFANASLSGSSVADGAGTAEADALLTIGSWAIMSPTASPDEATASPTARIGRRQFWFIMSILLDVSIGGLDSLAPGDARLRSRAAGSLRRAT